MSEYVDTQISELKSNEMIEINGEKYHFECVNAENAMDSSTKQPITFYTYNVYRHIVFDLIRWPVFSYECADKTEAKSACKEYLKLLKYDEK